MSRAFLGPSPATAITASLGCSLAAAGLAVAGFFVYRLLRPGLGGMKGPVILYTTVILAMALAALVRAPVVSGPAFWLPLSGAIFFIISDTVLAYRTFRIRLPV